MSNKLNEVLKFGSISRHIYAGSIFMISEASYKKLSAEQQAIFATAAKNSELYNRNLIVENEATYIKELSDKGVKINPIAEEELQKFRDAVKPIYKDYATKVGGMEFIDKVIATGEIAKKTGFGSD